nr:immunoglobulin heavy chain junction region [Mus musculus]
CARGVGYYGNYDAMDYW